MVISKWESIKMFYRRTFFNLLVICLTVEIQHFDSEVSLKPSDSRIQNPKVEGCYNFTIYYIEPQCRVWIKAGTFIWIVITIHLDDHSLQKEWS